MNQRVSTTRAEPGARAWLMFAAGAAAYGVAVLERTTLGVAGPEAGRHFGARAGIIATFVVVQLITYTAMQIPAGVLLDWFGTRRLVSAGLIVMGVGQAALAFADGVGLAMAARIVVGAGDALIFGSVIRLLPAWFPSRRVPVVTQLVALLGQAGQVVSAMPFAWLLTARGWREAFLGAASVAAVAALGVGVVLRDGPGGRRAPAPAQNVRQVRAAVVDVWRHPGTRLGMWTHWSASFATMVFALFWGFPYLTEGEGRSPRTASLLLALLVVAGAICGPVVGALTGRHPLRRSNLVLAVVAASVVPWVAVLLWPGPAPMPLLVALCIGLALGGPGSAIGFDYARTFAAPARLGTATGIVNLGGFTAALLCIQLIGLVLDLAAPGREHTLAQYRLAMAVQLPFYAAGVAGLLITRRQARRLLAAEGTLVPPWREALRREWRARTRGRR